MKTYQVTVCDNKRVEWRFEGLLHREDGPAVEFVNGSKYWYLNGELHRENGPAIEDANGNKEWRFNGELHREDGPAVIEPNGSKEWYINGELHREDGPAIEDPDGSKFWYLNGIEMPEQEHFLKTRAKKTCLILEGKEIEISDETVKDIKESLGL